MSTNLTITQLDEISVVDAGANQYATIDFIKRNNKDYAMSDNTAVLEALLTNLEEISKRIEKLETGGTAPTAADLAALIEALTEDEKAYYDTLTEDGDKQEFLQMDAMKRKECMGAGQAASVGKRGNAVDVIKSYEDIIEKQQASIASLQSSMRALSAEVTDAKFAKRAEAELRDVVGTNAQKVALLKARDGVILNDVEKKDFNEFIDRLITQSRSQGDVATQSIGKVQGDNVSVSKRDELRKIAEEIVKNRYSHLEQRIARIKAEQDVAAMPEHANFFMTQSIY